LPHPERGVKCDNKEYKKEAYTESIPEN